MKYHPKFTVVPMPLNTKGRGPEEDLTKVARTVYQVWDSACQTICECNDYDTACMLSTLLNHHLS